MVNTSIGEVQIKYKGKAYLFRPSFFALSKICEIQDPLELLKSLNMLYLVKDKDAMHSAGSLACCLIALQSAYVGDFDEDNLMDLLGCIVESKINKGLFLFKQGAVPQHDLIVIARNIVEMTLIGKPKVKPKRNSVDNVVIDPNEFVGCAVAHLGIENSKAWQMTMIEFQRAMESKFPEELEEKGMSKDDYDKLLEKAKERYH